MGTKFLSSFFHLPRLALTMVQHSRRESLFPRLFVILLVANVWRFWDHPTAIVNPLSVSIQSSGKKRLILDLRHVNLYIFKQKFKCEDLSVALKVMSKGYYLFKFDLKSGYHHVEIFPDFRKYFAFAWDFGDGVLKYFQFAVLPFGLSSAPYLFTKLLKPVLTSWRCKGIPMVIFLDDGLGGGANSIQAKINSLTVNADLLKFGLISLLMKTSPFGNRFRILCGWVLY